MAATWSTHDAGFFRVDLPPHWLAEQADPDEWILRDRPPAAARMTLRFKALTRTSPDSSSDPRIELQKWLYSENHAHIHHAPHLVTGTPYPTATVEASEPRDTKAAPPRPWYKRIFARRPKIHTRYWAIQNSQVLIFASAAGTAPDAERFRPMVDRIIHSLQLTEAQILLGRTFTETVVSLARTWFPQTAVAIVDDGHFQFGAQQVSISSLHRRYLASPQDFPRQVRAFLAAVRAESPITTPIHSWDFAREYILPTFITRGDRARNSHASTRLLQEWVNDLSIGYMLEAIPPPPLSPPPASPAPAGTAAAPEPQRPLTREDLLRWNVTLDDVHNQALANLVAQSHEQTMQGQKGEGYTLLCLGGNRPPHTRNPSPSRGAPPENSPGGDRHNAVRVLLPELHRKLREHLGPTFFAALPTPDLLIAFSIADADALERMREQIADDFARAADHGQGLSPKLFLITPDGVAGDPHDAEDFEL